MNTIESAVEEFERTTARMFSLVYDTPDDKLFWKPTPTGRSIGEIMAHAAHALENIAKQLQGTPFPIPSSAEADPIFRKHEATFTDRDQVVRYFTERRERFIEVLKSFHLDELDRMLTLPFGLGLAPLAYFMTAGHLHTQGHIAQIEYIQTLYGDHDWHTGF